jgi:replicative DNA helicase
MKVKTILESLNTKKSADFVMPTGFKELDEFLDGGFFRKELVVLGAATGGGKSLWAAEVFLNIAKKGFNSAYFSLEISNEMIVSRLIGQIANIKPSRIMRGFLNPEEFKRKKDAEIKLQVYENTLNFFDITYRLKDIEKEIFNNKYEFIVVDFIQNVIAEQKDEYTNLSLISLELQRIAKESNCCILIVSQLSNMALRGGFTEYKGSGSIAMVADLGFFLLRNMGDDDLDKDKLILKLAKNRRGFSGKKFGFQIVTDGALLVEIKLPDDR